ncbi:MAG: lytic transglycosylase domain-containing protein [Deltaproteobacteria bacterium]|nr:MAG: lytic transglycosylase domain-containing protein [Deltaproteobacteria bacterium]
MKMIQSIINNIVLTGDFRPFLGLLVFLLMGMNFYPALLKDVHHQDLNQITTTTSVYGPTKSLAAEKDPYNFFGVVKSFGKVPLHRLKELSSAELEGLVLASLPLNMRKRLRPYLSDALKISENHQVDPFWTLSIMYTESHFDPKVNSIVDARGLMQIMPDTGKFLAKIMDKNYVVKKPADLNRNSRMNIDMGVYYLNRLLKRYRYNYTIATVAYNMGPGNIRNMMIKGITIGMNNNYLSKVTASYNKITEKVRVHLAKIKRPYKETFIVRRRWRVRDSRRVFRLFNRVVPQNLAYLPSTKFDRKIARKLIF